MTVVLIVIVVVLILVIVGLSRRVSAIENKKTDGVPPPHSSVPALPHLPSVPAPVQPLPSETIVALGADQKFIFEQMENTCESMFITGGAGTGKSSLLRHFVKNTEKKNVVVVAPTGMAAINIGGQTIHSFF